MRKRQKTLKLQLRAVQGYEAAGDIAVERFAYTEAIAQFERALADGAEPFDEIRLCEKIGLALFFGARPDFAIPWYARAIDRCETTPALGSSAPLLMNLLGQIKWIEMSTQEAHTIWMRAHQLATIVGKKIDVRHTNIVISQLQIDLGKYQDVHPYVGKLLPGEATSLVQTGERLVAARIAASAGRASAAFNNFEKALAAAKEIPNGSFATTVWDEYANSAVELGRLDLSRNCRENALLVARERRILWRIPYLSLRMASTHLLYGEYGKARDLVRDALTYDTELPMIRVFLSSVGVKAGLMLKDDALVDRTSDESIVHLALKSGTQAHIAATVASHAQMFFGRGDLRRGRALISRGVAALKNADHAGDLLALAARYGSSREAEKARALLECRIDLPHSDVAEAYLKLWQTNEARRRRDLSAARRHAQAAANLFGQLGRRLQVTEALDAGGFLPDSIQQRPDGKVSQSLAQAELTRREREVADLLLRGLSNRAIAESLTISVHTVESHVTSILNRLGVRSRWQIIEASLS